MFFLILNINKANHTVSKRFIVILMALHIFYSLTLSYQFIFKPKSLRVPSKHPKTICHFHSKLISHYYLNSIIPLHHIEMSKCSYNCLFLFRSNLWNSTSFGTFISILFFFKSAFVFYLSNI